MLQHGKKRLNTTTTLRWIKICFDISNCIILCPQCVLVTVQTTSSSVMTVAVLTSHTPVMGSSTVQTALMKTSAQTVRNHCFPQSFIICCIVWISQWNARLKEEHKQTKHQQPLCCSFNYFSWQQQEVSDPPCRSVKPSSACSSDRGGRGQIHDRAQKDRRDHRTTSGQEQSHSPTQSQSTRGSRQSGWECAYVWRSLFKPY